MKIGLVVFTANTRGDNQKRPYDSIRAIARQAEADGFDSIWLADHLFYRNPGEPTRGIWELSGSKITSCGSRARGHAGILRSSGA